MKKKKTIAIAGLLVFSLLLLLVTYLGRSREKESEEFSMDYVGNSELPALLSFTYYDVKGWEEELSGSLKGKLNYQDLEDLLERLGVRNYVSYEAQKGYQLVPRQAFFAVYDQIVDLLDVKGRVSTKDMLFLGEEEKEQGWLTQDGYCPVRGPVSYLRQYDMYQTCLIDGEVAGLRQISTEAVTWQNIFVHKTQGEELEVLYEKESLTFSISGLKEDITDTVCDIEWKDGQVFAIY